MIIAAANSVRVRHWIESVLNLRRDLCGESTNALGVGWDPQDLCGKCGTRAGPTVHKPQFWRQRSDEGQWGFHGPNHLVTIGDAAHLTAVNWSCEPRVTCDIEAYV